MINFPMTTDPEVLRDSSVELRQLLGYSSVAAWCLAVVEPVGVAAPTTCPHVLAPPLAIHCMAALSHLVSPPTRTILARWRVGPGPPFAGGVCFG